MIHGGYYIKARCIQNSKIATAPPYIREIWDWLLKEVNHSENEKLKRGQTLRTFHDIIDGLKWYIGYRKMSYNKGQCENAMRWLRNEGMITTTKTTRGMIITICNYDYYQEQKNYESNNSSNTKATTKQQSTDTINKNDKNDKNEKNDKEISDAHKQKFEIFRKIYPATKRGLDTEFLNFKKHSDWEEVLNADLLQIAVKNQINWRNACKKVEKFCPEWKIMQTWINQRCWEEIHFTNELEA